MLERMCFPNEYIVFLVFNSVVYYEQSLAIIIYTCCYIYWNNHYGASQVLDDKSTMREVKGTTSDEARYN